MYTGGLTASAKPPPLDLLALGIPRVGEQGSKEDRASSGSSLRILRILVYD